jgi:hypothetical protein
VLSNETEGAGAAKTSGSRVHLFIPPRAFQFFHNG